MANGRYVARQVDGYVGPVVFKQETPVPSSRVLARHNGRWELIDLGPELDQWDRPLSTLYSFRALEGGERPPVIGSWDAESGRAPGPTLQYIEPAVGGAMSASYLTSSAQRAKDALIEREAQMARYSEHVNDPALHRLGNVTLFSGPRCTGKRRTITAAFREPLCTQCFDVCRKLFEDNRSPMHDEVAPPHSKVASLRVMAPMDGSQFAVHAYANCHGTWDYGKKLKDRVGVYTNTNGCVDFAPSDDARPVHFELKATAGTKSQSSEVPVAGDAKSSAVEPAASTATAGKDVTVTEDGSWCPGGCSGHGSCVARADAVGRCSCNEGWGPADCSQLTKLTVTTADANGDGVVSHDEFRLAMALYDYPAADDEAVAAVSADGPGSVEAARHAAMELFAVDSELALEMVSDRAEMQTLSELLQDVRTLGSKPGAAAQGAGVVVAAKKPPPPPMTVNDVDSDRDGTVSEEELTVAVAASTLWVEAEKQAALAAALDLLSVDAALATEMVVDGASTAVMRRLAQESARRLGRSGALPEPPQRTAPESAVADSTVSTSTPSVPLPAPSDASPENSIPSVHLTEMRITLDANNDGRVTAQELQAAIGESVGKWEESEKVEVAAVAQALHSLDPQLAVEMVADGASTQMMRQLAQEAVTARRARNRQTGTVPPPSPPGTVDTGLGDNDGNTP